ncbi:MAG: YceI family protein [Nibricoccus sp.]
MKSPLLLLLLLVLTSWSSAAETPLAVIPEKSHVKYDVAVPTKSFSGTLETFDLQLFGDPKTTAKITRAELRFRFADLHSGNTKRDQDMRNWQNTDQFPDVVFTVTALKALNTKNGFTGRGQLVFHGVTREIAFPVSILIQSDGTYIMDGEALVDTRDFDLPVIRKYMALKVDPVVNVRFHIEARPASQ